MKQVKRYVHKVLMVLVAAVFVAPVLSGQPASAATITSSATTVRSIYSTVVKASTWKVRSAKYGARVTVRATVKARSTATASASVTLDGVTTTASATGVAPATGTANRTVTSTAGSRKKARAKAKTAATTAARSVAKSRAISAARNLAAVRARTYAVRAAYAKATPCEVAVAKSAGTYWNCTFADDFNGTELDRSKWVVQETATSGYHSGPECYVDDGRNIAVSGGYLRVTAREESQPFTCKSPFGDYQSQMTGGSLSTWGTFSQTYGRFEIRAKFPSTKVAGVHSALWLWPQKMTYGAWPGSGEIDIAEFYSVYPDRAIPYLHYQQDGYDPTVTNTRCMIADPASFHTYVAEWTNSMIRISFDGKTCVQHTWNASAPLTGAAPFDRPFIVVLTQALGIMTNAYEKGATPLPATMLVDHVRVWS